MSRPAAVLLALGCLLLGACGSGSGRGKWTSSAGARAGARGEPIGVPGGASAGIGSIYVAHVRLPKPGRYWLLVQPGAGAEGATALGNLVGSAKPDAPAVGALPIGSG